MIGCKEKQLTGARPRIPRWLLVGIAVGVWLAAPRPAPAAAPPTVIVARSSDLAPYRTLEEAFSQGLGRPVHAVSLSAADGKEQLAAALTGATLVLAVGPEAARALGEQKCAAPVLLALVPSAAGVGFAPRTPTVPMFVAASRQLKLLRATLPEAATLGVLFDPALSGGLMADFEVAANASGLKLIAVPVTSRKEVVGAARELFGKVDVVWLVPDTTVVTADTFKFMVQTSLTSRVPLVGFSAGMARAGALLAIEAGYEEMGRSAALAARKLLAGTPAPAESPEGAVYLNAKIAELLGVPIPVAMRAQATRVFE